MPSDNYREYTVEQFILHPSFVAWVLQSDPGSSIFWEGWLSQNEDCRPRIRQARLLTTALHERYQQTIPEETIRKDLAALMRQIELPGSPRVHSFRTWLGQHWAMAASLTGLLFLATGTYLLWPARMATSVLTPQTWEAQTGLTKTLEKNNTRSSLSTVVLSDGSIVTLEPGSQLFYPPRFEGHQRKVYLQGEAFFEVAKNAAQPFLVYTGASVVRVVGTSFRIKASGQSPDQVAVRTGRVLVYSYQDFKNAGSNERLLAEKALVLLPNEQAILHPNSPIQKIQVQHAADVAAIIAPQELVYDDRPVVEVLEQMSSLYGVDMAYEREAMSRCKITASFREESLEERLRNICAAIGAEFKMENGKIVLSGQPCR